MTAEQIIQEIDKLFADKRRSAEEVLRDRDDIADRAAGNADCIRLELAEAI